GRKVPPPLRKIFCPQTRAKPLKKKKIPAPTTPQNMPPPACSLDSLAAAPGNRGPAAGVDHDAISVIESGRQTRVAVAARHDFGVWPYLETDLLERTTIFLCGATGKKNSRAINLLWQLSENCAQTFGRGKPEI